jgi:hypothetical protein
MMKRRRRVRDWALRNPWRFAITCALGAYALLLIVATIAWVEGRVHSFVFLVLVDSPVAIVGALVVRLMASVEARRQRHRAPAAEE